MCRNHLARGRSPIAGEFAGGSHAPFEVPEDFADDEPGFIPRVRDDLFRTGHRFASRTGGRRIERDGEGCDVIARHAETDDGAVRRRPGPLAGVPGRCRLGRTRARRCANEERGHQPSRSSPFHGLFLLSSARPWPGTGRDGGARRQRRFARRRAPHFHVSVIRRNDEDQRVGARRLARTVAGRLIASADHRLPVTSHRQPIMDG